MERIVVGVDGSEASKAALAWALDEARRRHAAIEVVHAWQAAYTGVIGWPGMPLDPGVYETAGRELIDSLIAASDVEGLDHPITTRLVCGGAASSILDAAKDADLVVVGARGHGGFTGLLLGSVSNQVVHHSTCPAVVVPVEN